MKNLTKIAACLITVFAAVNIYADSVSVKVTVNAPEYYVEGGGRVDFIVYGYKNRGHQSELKRFAIDTPDWRSSVSQTVTVNNVDKGTVHQAGDAIYLSAKVTLNPKSSVMGGATSPTPPFWSTKCIRLTKDMSEIDFGTFARDFQQSKSSCW